MNCYTVCSDICFELLSFQLLQMLSRLPSRLLRSAQMGRVHSPICGCPGCSSTKRLLGRKPLVCCAMSDAYVTVFQGLFAACRPGNVTVRGRKVISLICYSLFRGKGRPISPHVNIYKFPVPAISSITNRVTGTALSVGEYCSGLQWWRAFLSMSECRSFFFFGVCFRLLGCWDLGCSQQRFQRSCTRYRLGKPFDRLSCQVGCGFPPGLSYCFWLSTSGTTALVGLRINLFSFFLSFERARVRVRVCYVCLAL